MAEHPEFLDYIERIKDEKMWSEHEHWAHTTFFGKLTRSVMNYAKQSYFFGAVADAFAQQDDQSPYKRTLSLSLSVGMIVVAVIALFAIGRIVQMFIGEELVMEQQIIIETHVKLSDLMKEGDDGGNNDDAEEKEQKQIKTSEDGNRRNKKSKKSKVQ